MDETIGIGETEIAKDTVQTISREKESTMFSKLVHNAVQKAGKQEALAVILGLSSSALSKRINGEVGWSEHDIDRLLVFSGLKIVNASESDGKIKTLKEAMKIMMEDV